MGYTYYDLEELSEKMIDELRLIDRLKYRIDEKKALKKDRWPAIREKLRADWTHDSNAIEGSSLTRGETLFFLKEGLTVEGKPLKDFLDARNHAEAVDWLHDVIARGRPVTPGLIKEMNALLLSGLRFTWAINEHGQKVKKPAAPGQYKRLPNHVLKTDGTIHYYTDPIHTPYEMDALCQWVNDHIDTRHPLIVGATAHYNMVRIHPFDDGNGRGARMLMNLILIKKGFPPAIVRNETRRRYLDALDQADRGDVAPFLIRMAEALTETQKVIIEELNG